MGFSTDVRIIWPSTNASIPSGWSEDTDFADRYLQGGSSGFSGSANGGSTSHGHTGVAHSHTSPVHTHSISATNSSAKTVNLKPATVSGQFFAGGPHSHSGTSSTASLNLGNTTITVTSATAYPPSVKIIVIKPDDANQEVPDDAIIWADDITPPTGYDLADGGGAPARPDLTDKFLLGVASGADSDLTGLGAVTHLHSQSGNHGHSQNHLHSGVSINSTPSPFIQGSGTNALPNSHHTVTLNVNFAGISGDATSTSSASSLPAYQELFPIQNTSGGESTPMGVVVGFVGAVGTIPTSWTLCDGTKSTQNLLDKQVRCITSGSLSSGGSDTHTHTVDHDHGGSFNHSHSSNVSTVGGSSGGGGSTPCQVQSFTFPPTHIHSWTIGSTAATINSTVATMSSDDIRYKYRTLVFIKKVLEGESAQTLSSIEQSASGVRTHEGVSPQTLGAITQTAAGILTHEGIGAQTLGSISQVAVGAVTQEGVSTQILAALTQNSAGDITHVGVAPQILGALTQSASGDTTHQGVSTQTLAAITQVATGELTELLQGVSTQTLPSISQEAIGYLGLSKAQKQEKTQGSLNKLHWTVRFR